MQGKTNKLFYEIKDQWEHSEGKRIYDILMHVSTSHWCFNRNYNDLVKLFDFYQDNFDIWDVSKRDQLNVLLKDLLRLMQNYLSSSSALIDHVRVAVNSELQSELFRKKYEKHKEQIKDDALNLFLKNLRNYSIHKRMPHVSAKVEITADGSEQTSLFIHKEELIKWDKWASGAKQYLEGLDDEIPIRNIFSTHRDKFDQFHKDFYELAINHFQKEIKEYQELSVKLNKALQGKDT